MEKTKTVCKKRINIQRSYPAPYCQSWDPDVSPVLMKKRVNRSTGLKKPVEFSRGWSQDFTNRPDPTVPHLKYGVFRNRKMTITELGALSKLRRLPKNVQMQMKKKNPGCPVIKVPQDNIKVPQDVSRKTQAITAAKKPSKKVNSAFPPVLVFRNIEKSYSRQLSLSEITHMDIQPKSLASLPPSFCPSPKFKTIPRKLSVLPARLRFMGEH